MSEAKTTRNANSVKDFIEKVEHSTRKEDAWKLLKLFEKITELPAEMWGTSIIGFGSYHYVYASGREGDWPLTGFSPRKQNLSLYIMNGFQSFENQLATLGKHKVSKGCLYINKLSDIDENVLEQIIQESFNYMNEKYNG